MKILYLLATLLAAALAAPAAQLAHTAKSTLLASAALSAARAAPAALVPAARSTLLISTALGAARATAPARRAAVVPVDGWDPSDDPCDHSCKCTGSTNAATGQCAGSVRCCKCTGMHAVHNMCANIVCGDCVGDGCLQCIGGPNPSPLAGTEGPTASPTTLSPTLAPTTASPTGSPTSSPTKSPTASPVLSGPAPITIPDEPGTAVSLPEGSNLQREMYLGQFGAIDGCTLAVSYDWRGTTDGGKVWMYERSEESGWAFKEELTKVSTTATGENRFGVSIAIKGDTMVIGASWQNEGRGKAYVYVKENASWVQKAELISSDSRDNAAFSNTQFGGDVVIADDKNTIVVGSAQTDSRQGAAYVFYKPSGGWEGVLNPDHKLIANQRAAGSNFGSTVAIWGDTIVVGANGSSVRTNNGGAVYIYRKNSDDSWGQDPAVCYSSQPEIICSTENKRLLHQETSGTYQRFGASLELSDEVLVVGGMDFDLVYIYFRDSDTGDFEDDPDQRLEGDYRTYFGNFLSMDGPNLVIGAWSENKVYLYTRDENSGRFVSTSELTASDNGGGTYWNGDLFGYSVGISGASIFVGAPRATVGAASKYGKFYTFDDSSQPACPSL